MEKKQAFYNIGCRVGAVPSGRNAALARGCSACSLEPVSAGPSSAAWLVAQLRAVKPTAEVARAPATAAGKAPRREFYFSSR